jgi:hypothetical protein
MTRLLHVLISSGQHQACVQLDNHPTRVSQRCGAVAAQSSMHRCSAVTHIALGSVMASATVVDKTGSFRPKHDLPQKRPERCGAWSKPSSHAAEASLLSAPNNTATNQNLKYATL